GGRAAGDADGEQRQRDHAGKGDHEDGLEQAPVGRRRGQHPAADDRDQVLAREDHLEGRLALDARRDAAAQARLQPGHQQAGQKPQQQGKRGGERAAGKEGVRPQPEIPVHGQPVGKLVPMREQPEPPADQDGKRAQFPQLHALLTIPPCYGGRSMSTRDSDHFETKAIHAGQEPDPTTGAVMTPVYLTSTYAQSGPGEHKGFEYSRTRNPTRDALQDCLAALENGKHALAFASGLAATDAVLHLLSAGDHIVLSDDLYGGTFRLADKVFKRLGIEQSYVDVTDPKVVEGAFRPNTRLLWVETPTNPMLKICDLAALAEGSRKRGAISVCDNTFATPFFQRPLEFGFDVVAHSMTKYLNGHSDVVAGALVLRRDDLHEKLAFLQNAVGGVPGPLDSFLVLRGLKTLHVRM